MFRFDFTVGPNPTDSAMNIDAEGDYVFYYTGAGQANNAIRLKAEGGGLDVLMVPGEAVRLPKTSTRWQVENFTKAGTIVGVIVVGKGEFQGNRLVGDVQLANVAQLAGALFTTEDPAIQVTTGGGLFMAGAGFGPNTTSVASDGVSFGMFVLYKATGLFSLTKLRMRKLASAAPNGLFVRRIALVGLNSPLSPFYASGAPMARVSGVDLHPDFYTIRGLLSDTLISFSQQIYSSRQTAAEDIVEVPLPRSGIGFTGYTNVLQVYCTSQAVDAAFEVLDCHARSIE